MDTQTIETVGKEVKFVYQLKVEPKIGCGREVRPYIYVIVTYKMLTYVPIRKGAKEAVTRFRSSSWEYCCSAARMAGMVGEGNGRTHGRGSL